MTAGAVVRAADIQADRLPGGASMTMLLDTGSGGPGLVRRLVEVPPGARLTGTAGAGGELWFVIQGSAQLDLDAEVGPALAPDRGLWIPPGAAYELEADGDGELRLDVVTLPAAVPGAAAAAADPAATGSGPAATDSGPAAAVADVPLSRDLRDCDVETTGDREFRVLFGPGQGCSVATQFVGEIPPGRAPDHSHPYDEVVLIMQGEGLAHIGGADHELEAGTCLHLPPGLLHCLENTGPGMMRVLGVFHPADSPAAKLQSHS
jgi:quercetin dioxygenase-like cupin family protein